jgi:hypothetical protein
MHPSGGWLYVANRFSHNISVFDNSGGTPLSGINVSLPPNAQPDGYRGQRGGHAAIHGEQPYQ